MAVPDDLCCLLSFPPPFFSQELEKDITSFTIFPSLEDLHLPCSPFPLPEFGMGLSEQFFRPSVRFRAVRII